MHIGAPWGEISHRPQALLVRAGVGAGVHAGPQKIGWCIAGSGRTAKFLVDASKRGDALLDSLAKYPEAPARPAKPYGSNGWLVEH
ncbi:MAG TPA: hypothetical protein VJ935_00350 [Acidimicrobiia bacterium]|nr:hypothetical protein [Acidimicrobiia bacterium]